MVGNYLSSLHFALLDPTKSNRIGLIIWSINQVYTSSCIWSIWNWDWRASWSCLFQATKSWGEVWMLKLVSLQVDMDVVYSPPPFGRTSSCSVGVWHLFEYLQLPILKHHLLVFYFPRIFIQFGIILNTCQFLSLLKSFRNCSMRRISLGHRIWRGPCQYWIHIYCTEQNFLPKWA